MNDRRRSVGTRPEVQGGKRDRIAVNVAVSRSLGLLIALFLLALVLPAGASAAECTNTWTGPAEGSWATAGNWSAKHVPTSTEVACIGSGKTVNITSGTRQVKMLQGEGTLTITESSLKITATAEASGIKNLTVGYTGILTGAATLKVSNSLSWAGGTMSGTGSTVLQSGGSATVETATLSERTLVNEGTVTFPSSYFVVSNGATVKNTGTFNANSSGVSGITTEGKGPNTIINTGTFRKTAGTETTVVSVGFENKATVNCEKGTLEFLNSAVTLASGSELKGTNYFKGATIAGASFTAPSGTVTLRESTVTMASGKTAKIANLTGEYEGRISGAGTLEVSNSLSWESQDRMTGTGSTLLLSGATGTVGNGDSISERTLVNKGTITYTEGYMEMLKGATLENVGTFNANSESVSGIVPEGEGATPLIVNMGTFHKTAGEETTLVGVEFDNEGTVHTASGQLRFFGGGSSTSGTWSAGEGSLIGFTGESPFKFVGGGLSGAIEVNTGSVTEEGLENTNLSLTVTAPKSPYTASFSVEKGTMDAKEVSLTDYGTLASAGTVDVSNSLTIAAGWLTGTGSTILQSGGTGNLEEGARLYEGTLVNEGTMTYSNGFVEMYNGATFENAGTFNANSENVSGIVREGEGALPRIVNTGTFHKTAGEGTTLVQVEFDNKGTVHTASGQLRFFGGGSSTAGTWSAGEGSSIAFAGESPFTFAGGGLSGAVEVDTVSVAEEGLENTNLSLTVKSTSISYFASFSVEKGTMSAKNLTLEYNGILAGAGTVEVSNSLTVSYGWQAGTGSTILQSGGTGTIGEAARIYERTLVNEGTMTYSEGYIEMYNGATLENVGTFNANSENVSGIVREGEGAAPLIVNTGTFHKTAGEGTTLVQVDFENQGTIDDGPGHIKIEHPVAVMASDHFGKHCNCGDPVDSATGNYSETQTDFAIGGRGVGLDLTRTYSAQVAATAGSPGAFGYGWSNSFGDHLIVEGETATVVEDNGNTVPFVKSGGSFFKAPTWSQDTLSGSTEAGYTLTLPEQTKDKFSGVGKLESVTDRNGNATTLTYNKLGQLETITDPVSRKITLTYNGEGLIEKAKDPMGHEVKYTYESKNLKTVTLPGETEPNWQFEYDGSHRMTSMTDGRGGKTTNEYDGSNRVVSQTDPAKRTLIWDYEPFHTTITNEATGAVTDERFTSNNEPFSVTRGFGTANASTETFSYNNEGRMLSSTDGNGHKTTYAYDAHGNRTSATDAAKDETQWTYNETHDVITETKPGGEKTTITRDEHGNPETILRPAPSEKTQTTSFEYGTHGELKSMTDPLKRTWQYEYDSYGDCNAETDPEGDKRTSAYNEDSLLTSVVSPRGNEEGAESANYTTTIERDAQGRPKEVIDPLEHKTKYAYDPNGNVESETDPNSHKTKYTYDADNEPTKVEMPKGNTVETVYDGAGQVIGQTDGNKHTTTYVRNVLEQPIEVKDPLSRVTKEEFDAAGNLKKLTDPAKRETSYTHDAANRLTEITYSDKVTPNVKYEYDADGNVKHITDGTGEASYTFDQLDRLTKSKDGHGDTVEYKYDLGNQQTEITYPNGKSVTQAFDNVGRLKTVTDWLEHATTFAYDRDSDPKTTTFPTGTTNVDEYAYDRADQMSEVKMKKGVETLASLGYSRDKAGQVESLTSKGLPGAEEEAFTYDENNRLTKAGAGSYEYDAANNLTKTPGSTNTYDNASQLEKGTGSTYAYDELGERTKLTPSAGPATTYKYDQAGRVTAVERPKEGETPAISESYTYDGTGLLASQTVSGSTSYLTWDTSGSLPMLFSDGHNSYIYGPGGVPVEQISSEETPTYYHHDQLGSTRMLTSASGNSSGTFTYGAYGGLTGSTGSQTTPLGFAGEYTETQSGLQYLRARFFDPVTGQFLSRDPIESLTRQPYSYANDNPLNLTDPSGRFGEAVAACGATFVVPGVDEATCGAAAGEVAIAGSAILACAIFGCDETMNAPHAPTAAENIKYNEEAHEECPLRDTPDQEALSDLGKEAARRGGVSPDEAETLREWAEEYEFPFRGPEEHPNKSKPWSRGPHIHVGRNGRHIPVG